MFQDREEAGYHLAEALREYSDRDDVIVVCVPRGGIVPGLVVSNELNLPLDVVLVKKIGAPGQAEFAIGASSEDTYWVNPNYSVSETYLETKISEIQELLKNRREQYSKLIEAQDLTDRIILLVDDGIATGSTYLSAIELLKTKQPKAIIAAIPVGPPTSCDRISKVADKLVCLYQPTDFRFLARFYQNFPQLSDEEVIEMLESRNG